MPVELLLMICFRLMLQTSGVRFWEVSFLMHPISCCLLPCHWPVCLSLSPVGVGLALVLGVFINYFSVPKGDATVLFSGVFLIVLAIIFNGMASGKVAKGGTDQAMRKKGGLS